jgi:acetylglutamate kinase
MDEKGKVFLSLQTDQIEDLIDKGVIKGGMIPKLRACVSVLEAGVKEIHICGWKNREGLINQVISDQATGTVLRL